MRASESLRGGRHRVAAHAEVGKARWRSRRRRPTATLTVLVAGDLRGDETPEATATITVRGLSRDVVVTGTIALA